MPSMPDASLSELVMVELSARDRAGLDVVLAPLCGARDPRVADLASRCRQAVNARAVLLGFAPEREQIAFLPEEIAFLRDRIRQTVDKMGALLVALG